MSVAFNGRQSGVPLARVVAALFMTRLRPPASVGPRTAHRATRLSSTSPLSAPEHDARLENGWDSRLGAGLWRWRGDDGFDEQGPLVDVTSFQNSKAKRMREGASGLGEGDDEREEPARELLTGSLRLARSFHKRRTRDEQGKTLVEGHRLVCDLIEGGHSPDLVLVSHEALTAPPGPRLLAALETLPADVVAVATPDVVQHCCDTVTAQGVVALVARPDIPLPTTLQTVLICDGIQDPGNLGTLVRTAAGLGADTLILTGTCVDYWGPKTLRCSMGAAFRLPSLRLDTWDEVVDLMRARGVRIYAAEGRASLSYFDADWTAPSALVVGAEARGLGDDAREGLENGDVTGVSIPLAQGVESLNAAVAGAIVLGEAQRQRAVAGRRGGMDGERASG